MTNLPPFYIGQRVVALVTKNNDIGVVIKKNNVYTVLRTQRCGKCGQWHIDVGVKFDIKEYSNECGSCPADLPIKDNTAWCYVQAFAPITENFQSITLEKVLETETPLISVN